MIRHILGTLIGAALIVWVLAGCERPIACPVPVDAAPVVDAAPCLAGFDIPSALYVNPLKTGRRSCWRTAAGIVCPSEPPSPTVGLAPIGEFATADAWRMIDNHAAQWNALAEHIDRCVP